jgi:cardiolipin synthase A/B
MEIEKAIVLNNKTLTLVHSGEDYFNRLEQIILQSEFEIHLQTYIFEYDTIGKKIIDALLVAVSRKVRIYILIDGFGSFNFPGPVINNLKEKGINIRFFSPFFSANSFYLGRRLHHKIVVSDSKIVLIGGINIADKYLGTDTNLPWLDYAVEFSDKNCAQLLSKLCYSIYFKKRNVDRLEIKTYLSEFEFSTIKVIQNDWLKRKNEISTSYINAINNSKEEIVIVGSYFLPGKKLFRALKKASKNKVKIKLILSGISDLPMARRASCYLYAKLLRYDIELYEWKKSVLHGKAAIIDHQWTTIGSFNLNNLSSFGSVEMNVEVNSTEFSTEYLSHLNKIISECEIITSKSILLNEGIFSKIINWISYWTTRLIEIIITYLPQKRFMKFY